MVLSFNTVSNNRKETMTRTITDLTIYWDTQDRSNEGWAYRASDDDGLIDSGSIDGNVADNDLDGAIKEACRYLGMELTADQFAREPFRDGGFAIWSALEDPGYFA
jgi:hypothetical protein